MPEGAAPVQPDPTAAATSTSHPLQQALTPRTSTNRSQSRVAGTSVGIPHRMRRDKEQRVFSAHVAAAKESFRRGGYTAEDVARYHLGEHADQRDFNELVAILKSTS